MFDARWKRSQSFLHGLRWISIKILRKMRNNVGKQRLQRLKTYKNMYESKKLSNYLVFYEFNKEV